MSEVKEKPVIKSKTVLIEMVAADCELSVAEAKRVVDSTFDIITKLVSEGNGVNLKGFGNFTSVFRPARKGRNPHSGEAIEIQAKHTPHFKSAKAFKDAVNGQ